MGDYEAIISIIQKDGCSVKYPIELPDCSVLTVDGQDAIMPIACMLSFATPHSDFHTDLTDWECKHIGLPNFIDAFDECPITSLEDLIQFNKYHVEQAMPPREYAQNPPTRQL